MILRLLTLTLCLLTFACTEPAGTDAGNGTGTGSGNGAGTDTSKKETPSAFSKAPGVPDDDVSKEPDSGAAAAGIYALTADSLDGKPVELADYKGKVSLVVNVASECGYTRQYAGLQKLHADLKDRGFAVLGFPSNEFGGQEPGTPEQIREFCTSKFGVEFPMFAKVETKKGDGQSPVYSALTSATGEQPKWNFCKYLVGKDGKVLGFYPSSVAPDSAELRKTIEAALE